MAIQIKHADAVITTIGDGDPLPFTFHHIADEPPPPEGTLADAVDAHNTAHASEKVLVSGTESWVNTSPSSGNKDYIDANPAHGIRQHGPITRVKFDVGGTSHIAGWKFKVWRKSGTIYTVVGESEAFTTTAFGAQTRDLTTPITGCQPGDFLGVYVPSGAVFNTEYPAPGFNIIYVTGDNSTLSNPTPASNWFPRLEAYGPPPFLPVIGDSIQCGHGEAFHRPFLDSGISGDPAGESASYLRAAMPALSYQNFSKGSQTWAWGASQASAMAALTPKAFLCHFGPNDVSAARSWGDIEDDMDAVKAALPTGTKLFVCEALPWTSGSDTQAAAIRSLNANYATWCAANGAALIQCHDAMGQIRTSTGELDDLKTAYDHDGIHLTILGTEALADIMLAALDTYEWAA